RRHRLGGDLDQRDVLEPAAVVARLQPGFGESLGKISERLLLAWRPRGATLELVGRKDANVLLQRVQRNGWGGRRCRRGGSGGCAAGARAERGGRGESFQHRTSLEGMNALPLAKAPPGGNRRLPRRRGTGTWNSWLGRNNRTGSARSSGRVPIRRSLPRRSTGGPISPPSLPKAAARRRSRKREPKATM